MVYDFVATTRSIMRLTSFINAIVLTCSTVLLFCTSRVFPQQTRNEHGILDLFVSHSSTTLLIIEWYAHSDGISDPHTTYTLSIDPDENSDYPKSLVFDQSPMEYEFSNLFSGTQYVITVAAVDENGDTIDEASISAKTIENPCNQNPCQHGGTCRLVVGLYTAYVCFCPPCFEGTDCQIGLNACESNPCLNGGKCLLLDSSCQDYNCECDGCFTGERCQTDIDPCASNPCSSHGNNAVCTRNEDGSCDDYTCFCQDPDEGCFVGKTCERRYDPCYPNPCKRGQCNRDDSSCSYSCSCPGCYMGEDCDQVRNPCDPNPCGDNGMCYRVGQSCIQYSCACHECYAGKNCETFINDACSHFSPCRNGGTCESSLTTCNEYTCSCPECFTGELCQEAIDPCQPNPCMNDGECIHVPGSCTEFKCQCKNCFIGDVCDISNDGCVSSPCSNDGTCTPLATNCESFTCDCTSVWIGKTCNWHIGLVIVIIQLGIILIIWCLIMTVLLYRRRNNSTRKRRRRKESDEMSMENSSGKVELTDLRVQPTENVANGTDYFSFRVHQNRTEDSNLKIRDARNNINTESSDEGSNEGCCSRKRKGKGFKKLSSLTLSYLNYTSWHGFGRIGASRSIITLSIWVIICIVALSVFLWQGTLMVLRFYGRPIGIDMSEFGKTKIKFPAVTICNTNKLRVSALVQSKYFPFVNLMNSADYHPYYVPCQTGDFKCNNGIHCINNFLVCDGIWHCPDTSDEFGCDYDSYKCGSDQFKCSGGGTSGICIPEEMRCNGIDDCYHREDELNCDVKETPELECPGFHCDDGICHPLSDQCNYITDCIDATDETDCQFRDCQAWEFTCDNRKCIDNELACNWRDNCGDNSDEKDCNYRKCTEDEFTCQNGQCIEGWRKCNNYIECNDRSDETNCTQSFTCLDSNEECSNWAEQGECEQNKVFMLSNCPISCGVCEGKNVFAAANSSCPEGFFRCSSGFCIDSIHKCDTIANCKDAKDEYWPQCVHREPTHHGREILFEENWHAMFRNISTDSTLFSHFENYVFQDPGFNRVERESPPDWNRFATFSSTPDFSDLRRVLKLDKAQIKAFGHQARDFILHCSYDGTPCDYRDFYWLPNDVYGSCYIFNGGSSDIKYAYNAGSNTGLKLTLYVEQDEYLGIYGQSAGVRIAVHANDEVPWPEDIGLTAKTGAATSFAIKQRVTGRLGKPWGSCHDHILDDNFFKHAFNYSSLTCKKNCVQKYMQRYCNCTDSIFETGKQCPLLSIKQEACRQIMHFFYQKGLLQCGCTPLCYEESYETTLSLSTWPSDSYMDHLLKSLHSVNSKSKKITDMRSAQKNLASIHVYYGTLSTDLVNEVPAYTREDLASDIGGLLGLYIGVSVITVVELMEYIKNVFVLACVGIRKYKKSGNSSQLVIVEDK